MEHTTAERNGPVTPGALPMEVHVVPLQVLLAVFGALVVLTYLTVKVAQVDLGAWNLFGALAIASIKATLVALYFMHLRYESAFYSFLFVTGLAFLALFLGLTLIDAVAYQPDIQEFRQATGL